MEVPGVVVRHDGVDALVEVEDAIASGRRGDAEHDVGTAAIVVRMRQAMGMAELVQHDGEGEAALLQAFLAGKVPAAAVDVERADPLLRPEGRILGIEIGAELLGSRRDQPELGCGGRWSSPHTGGR